MRAATVVARRLRLKRNVNRAVCNMDAPNRCFSQRPVVHSSKEPALPGTKSYMEIEKEIASYQRGVRECFNAGLFSDGIDGAKETLKIIEKHFGKDHPVYASTLNDMAVMNKVSAVVLHRPNFDGPVYYR